MLAMQNIESNTMIRCMKKNTSPKPIAKNNIRTSCQLLRDYFQRADTCFLAKSELLEGNSPNSKGKQWGNLSLTLQFIKTGAALPKSLELACIYWNIVLVDWHFAMSLKFTKAKTDLMLSQHTYGHQELSVFFHCKISDYSKP